MAQMLPVDEFKWRCEHLLRGNKYYTLVDGFTIWRYLEGKFAIYENGNKDAFFFTDLRGGGTSNVTIDQVLDRLRSVMLLEDLASI